MGKKNVGKIFEECFIKSVPKYCWSKRPNDNPAAYAGSAKTQYSTSNECDFIIRDDRDLTLYGLELKTTLNRLTFFREDFVIEGKKQDFAIRKCQIEGLHRWSQHPGVFGFVFNFRDADNHTYFVTITDFLSYTDDLDKKSINQKDVLQMNPIEIYSRLLKVNYRYDIERFLSEV